MLILLLLTLNPWGHNFWGQRDNDNHSCHVSSRIALSIEFIKTSWGEKFHLFWSWCSMLILTTADMSNMFNEQHIVLVIFSYIGKGYISIELMWVSVFMIELTTYWPAGLSLYMNLPPYVSKILRVIFEVTLFQSQCLLCNVWFLLEQRWLKNIYAQTSRGPMHIKALKNAKSYNGCRLC